MTEVKFLVDGMLGKLAKWLRFMGFFAEYTGSEKSDSDILEYCRENKLFLLTRDRELCSRFGESMYIESDDYNEQMKQVLTRFPPNSSLYFTRCPVCNGLTKKIDTSEILDPLPEGVKKRFQYIYMCEDCGKVYWEGSHFDAILDTIGKFVKDL